MNILNEIHHCLGVALAIIIFGLGALGIIGYAIESIVRDIKKLNKKDL